MKNHVDAAHARAVGLPAETPAKYLKVLDAAEPGLVVHEIYASVQGESTHAGRPCTFIRLSACHLRCSYCDTPHAFGQGERMSRSAVLDVVRSLEIGLVELTGGEPLLQAEALPLMSELADAGFEVLLETSGALDIRPVDERVKRIVDLKTPSSGEVAANRWDNLEVLRPQDEVKVVIGSRDDYLWAKGALRQHDIAARCPVLFGVVHGALEAEALVEWILEDRLPVRFQLQMHKFIWDPSARGV
ncbi:MAG: radical SAM protein [Myxococcota bacterium]